MHATRGREAALGRAPAHGGDPAPETAHERCGFAFSPRGFADARNVIYDVAERMRVQRNDFGWVRQRVSGLNDCIVVERANVAQGLRQNDVRGGYCQCCGVEGVEPFAASQSCAHLAVYPQAGRAVRVDCAAHDDRFAPRLGG